MVPAMLANDQINDVVDNIRHTYLWDYLKLGSKRKSRRIIYLLDKLARDLSRQDANSPFEETLWEQMRQNGRGSHNDNSDGLVSAIKEGEVHVIVVKSTSIGCPTEPGASTKIKDVIEAIAQKISQELVSDNYYIIMFPEGFFNEFYGDVRKPLSSEQVNEVIGACGPLSSDNVLVSLCFLHKFSADEDGLWLPQWQRPKYLGDKSKKAAKALSKYVSEDLGEDAIAKIAGNLFQQGLLHVANYNVFIWNGVTQCVYRKSVYFNEISKINAVGDDWLFGCESSGCGSSRRMCSSYTDVYDWAGCWSDGNGNVLSTIITPTISADAIPDVLYEFGDFEVHVTDTGNRDIKQLFVGTDAPIVPLICGDVQVLVEGSALRRSLLRRLSRARLLLISSNGLSFKFANEKLGNIIKGDQMGVIADKTYHSARVVSSKGPRELEYQNLGSYGIKIAEFVLKANSEGSK